MQRFSSALNCHLHFHVFDGVYACVKEEKEPPRFYLLRPLCLGSRWRVRIKMGRSTS